MKKQLIIASVAALFMASCNQQSNETSKNTETASAGPTELRIAYIEVDSVMNQYTFCKESTATLEAKAENIDKTISSKAQNLQSAANKFQQDIQNNKYTQQQAEAVQAQLQKQNSDLQNLQQRLSSEFQAETNKFNEALHDSIQHYIAVYNKDKKYTMILTKSGDNILYADKSLDITDEFIAGLNKAYKGAPKSEARKDGKK